MRLNGSREAGKAARDAVRAQAKEAKREELQAASISDSPMSARAKQKRERDAMRESTRGKLSAEAKKIQQPLELRLQKAGVLPDEEKSKHLTIDSDQSSSSMSENDAMVKERKARIRSRMSEEKRDLITASSPRNTPETEARTGEPNAFHAGVEDHVRAASYEGKIDKTDCEEEEKKERMDARCGMSVDERTEEAENKEESILS